MDMNIDIIQIAISAFLGVCLTEKMHNIDGNEGWQ